MPARSRLLPLALALAACQGEPSAVRLVIDTDADVPEELDEIEVTLTASRTEAGDFCEPATESFNITSRAELPLPVVVEAGDEYDVWILYRVIGLRDDIERLRVEGTERWHGPGTYDVDVALDHRCLELACDPGQVCSDQRCDSALHAHFIDDHRSHDEGVLCESGAGTGE